MVCTGKSTALVAPPQQQYIVGPSLLLGHLLFVHLYVWKSTWHSVEALPNRGVVVVDVVEVVDVVDVVELVEVLEVDVVVGVVVVLVVLLVVDVVVGVVVVLVVVGVVVVLVVDVVVGVVVVDVVVGVVVEVVEVVEVVVVFGFRVGTIFDVAGGGHVGFGLHRRRMGNTPQNCCLICIGELQWPRQEQKLPEQG